MKKQNRTFIALIAIVVVIFAGYKGFGWEVYINEAEALLEQMPREAVNQTDEKVGSEAWQVLTQYMGYAHAHDLEGVKSLSAKISPICADAAKQTECFALMDNVYNIYSQFGQEDFTHVLSDENKITLYTDYQDNFRVAIYFTKKDTIPKEAGMRFCYGNESIEDQCSSLLTR